MIRILVPVDFGAVSINAAEYAIQMAAGFERAEVVLFHAYDLGGIGADGSPVASGSSAIQDDLVKTMEALQVQLYNKASVPTDFFLGKGQLLDEMKKLIQKQNFDFVVMGISGANSFDERFAGSNVLDVVDMNLLPVVIVGSGMHYRPISKLAIAIDLHEVEKVVPLQKLIPILNALKPELHVVYASGEVPGTLTDAEKAEQEKLDDMLGMYHPYYSNLYMNHFVDALNTYVHQHQIDMVMVLPQKHSFISRMLQGTHTKKLAFHSVAPVFAVHA